MLRLVIRCGDHRQTCPAPTDEIRAGTAADNDLVLPYPGVSSHHSLLRLQGRDLLIRDLGSKNGVVWQGRRVSEARLGVGQEVQLGYATLGLEEISTSEAEVALTLDDGTGSRLSTMPVAELPQSSAGDSSPAAALHVVRKLDAAVDFDLGKDSRMASLAQRALGASTLVVFGLSEDGELALVGCAGDLPTTRWSHDLAAAAREVGDGHLPASELVHGDESCLLAGSATPTSRFLVALFPPGCQITEWRRDFFDYLARRVRVNADESPPESAPERAALRFPPDVVLGDSPALGRLLGEMRATVRTEFDVLLLGETGTGKEIFARMIHASGPTADGPFVAVNSAAIPSELLEAELFGIARRVATGVDPRSGRFSQADGGTLFLDEVGDLAEPLQAKLLRVLEEREVLALGAPEPQPIQVRVISASNRQLGELMAKGKFRTDLYHRLAQLSFRLPPLRDRREDIPQLVLHFAGSVARQHGKHIVGVSRKALDRLLDHPWPGNVRELQNVVRRAVLVCPNGGTIESNHLDLLRPASEEGRPQPTLLQDRIDVVEREAIVEALRKTHGNKTRAAEILGLTRNGLDSKMKRLGLSADDFRS